VVASPEELNQWLQSTSGEAVGVHFATPGSDLLKDLRASVAAQKETKNSPRDPKSERMQRPVVKAPKTGPRVNPNRDISTSQTGVLSLCKSAT
jgi:hypothetical protein